MAHEDSGGDLQALQEQARSPPAASRAFQGSVLTSYLALTILLNLLGRYNRAGESTFCASALVVVTESIKLAGCVMLSLWQVGRAELRAHVLSRHTFMFMLPSVAFTIQKNLDLASIKRLELPIYMLVIEGKTVMTAIWSHVLLGRRFSTVQIAALVLLTTGDALAVGALDYILRAPGGSAQGRRAPTSGGGFGDREYLIGALCGLLGIFLTSLASVFSERLLKAPGGSLAVRNVQIGCSALPAALLVLVSGGDLPRITEHGLLQGFTPAVWSLAGLTAIAGMVMAAILRYVNAVAIGFVRAVALATLTLISIPLFHFKVKPSFVVGTTLVVGSMVLYALASNDQRKAHMSDEESTLLEDGGGGGGGGDVGSHLPRAHDKLAVAGQKAELQAAEA